MATPIQNNTEALWEILETAQTLPVVNEVKVARGTCTGDDETGACEVDLGFKPDIVMFPDFYYQDYTDPSKVYGESVVMWFAEMEGYARLEVCGYQDGDIPTILMLKQTGTGFRITGVTAEWRPSAEQGYGWFYFPNLTLNYIAMKYTP